MFELYYVIYQASDEQQIHILSAVKMNFETSST